MWSLHMRILVCNRLHSMSLFFGYVFPYLRGPFMLGYRPHRRTRIGRPGPRQAIKRPRRRGQAHQGPRRATSRNNGPGPTGGRKRGHGPPVEETPRGDRYHTATPQGRLKISRRRIPAGHNEGRTVPPSTYGGGLKVSGRTDPAGRNSTATTLWEQLQRHGRRLGSLSRLA